MFLSYMVDYNGWFDLDVTFYYFDKYCLICDLFSRTFGNFKYLAVWTKNVINGSIRKLKVSHIYIGKLVVYQRDCQCLV